MKPAAAPAAPAGSVSKAATSSGTGFKKTAVIDLLSEIIKTMDPYAALYSAENMRDAAQTIRESFLEFVTGPAHKWLGPKKSRTLALWLSGNKIPSDRANILKEFLTFMLEEPFTSSWTDMFQDKSGNWYVRK